MNVHPQKKEVVEFVVNQLNKLAKNDNVMQFFLDTEQDYSLALSECFQFNIEVPRDIRRRNCSIAIAGILQKNEPFTIEKISNRLDKTQSEYLKKPKTQYVLLTRLSVCLDTRLPQFKSDAAKIQFSKKAPSGFEISGNEPPEELQLSDGYDYCWVRVFVETRCPQTAVSVASQELDFFRSIWNLTLNLKKHSRTSIDGRPSHVNDIVLGPSDTIHFGNGKLVQKGVFWFRPSYRKPVPPKGITSYRSDLLEANKTIQRKVKKMDKRFGTVFRETLRRYVAALDEPDMATSFTCLWGALEAITDTYRENIVKRTLKICESDELRYNEHFLDTCRGHRNTSVHASDGIPDSEIRVFRLKSYVERFLLFVLQHSEEFSSFDDYVKFLDLSDDPCELKRKLDITDFALRRRTKSSARKKK